MSGNFGGNSIPTVAVDAAALVAGASTTYKDWKCKTVVVVRATQDFNYNGTTIFQSAASPVVGSSVDLIMDPSLVDPDGVIIDMNYTLLCYPCSCENPVVSPVVITSGDTNYQNYGPNNKPIIIGGGGLNS
tara:strand:- start:582 stop:974 length:393 start_codon:yes stop_codon:yes gene_type:complete